MRPHCLQWQCRSPHRNPQSVCLHGNAHDTPYSPSEDRRNHPDVHWPPRSGDSSGSHSPHLHCKGSPEQTSATMPFSHYSSVLHQDYRNPRYLPVLRRSRNRDIQNLLLLPGLRFSPLSFPCQYQTFLALYLYYCKAYFFISIVTTPSDWEASTYPSSPMTTPSLIYSTG